MITLHRVTEENYPDPDVPTTFAPPSPAVEDKNKTSIDDFDIYSADENYDYWSKEVSHDVIKLGFHMDFAGIRPDSTNLAKS